MLVLISCMRKDLYEKYKKISVRQFNYRVDITITPNTNTNFAGPIRGFKKQKIQPTTDIYKIVIYL